MFARRRESTPANSISIRSSVFTRLIGSSGSTLGWGGGTNPSKSWLPPKKLSGPQIVARRPNLAVLMTHCSQLIRRKIS